MDLNIFVLLFAKIVSIRIYWYWYSPTNFDNKTCFLCHVFGPGNHICFTLYPDCCHWPYIRQAFITKHIYMIRASPRVSHCLNYCPATLSQRNSEGLALLGAATLHDLLGIMTCTVGCVETLIFEVREGALWFWAI